MQFKRFLTLALLLASATVVRANGDPVAVRSALTLSPTPVAVHVPEVQLIDEHATFVPRGLYTEVTVRYLLHNRSSRSFDSLPYGFPIDYYGEGEAHWIGLDGMSESEREVGWRDGYIRNVTFMLGDRQLRWQHSRDTVISPARKYIVPEILIDIDTAGRNFKYIEDSLNLMYGEDMYIYTAAVSRRWYYTYLDIPAHSFAVLEVRYTVETPLSEGAYYRRENYYQYVGNYYWDLRFQYDFTPAAYWGDGHADHFSVLIDASEVDIPTEEYWHSGFEDRNQGIGGLPMKQKGSLWHYEAHRFDLAAAKPLILDYRLKQRPQQPMGRILNNRIDPSQFTVTVSGADKKYPAANLFDLDPSTATVLRPDKHDSIYITLRFKKPTSLEGMMILNGYTKNADTWRNNARIDSILAFKTSYEVYGPIDEEGTMDTTFYNNEHEIGFAFSGRRPVSVHVEGRELQNYGWQSLLDNASTFRFGNPWGEEYYTELRILVTATVKGLKYDDLCVSEIILIGK